MTRQHQRMLVSHLSWVEGRQCIALHEEHVNKVDEHARSVSGVFGSEDDPLVQNHEHEVAKQTKQEQQLWEKNQVQAVPLSKVPVGVDRRFYDLKPRR